MTFSMLHRAVARRFSLPTFVLGVTAFVLAATHVFAWPGTYDLVGTGFPEGSRRAVLQITRRDTTYSVTALMGPPGSPVSVRVTGDTARIVWDFENEDPPMFIELLGAGDSLTGRWTIGTLGGTVSGRRR
jgi:hypothetical protein